MKSSRWAWPINGFDVADDTADFLVVISGGGSVGCEGYIHKEGMCMCVRVHVRVCVCVNCLHYIGVCM